MCNTKQCTTKCDTFSCCICKNTYCVECKIHKLVNNKMNCLDCYSNLEYMLYTATMNQDIYKIKKLIKEENFSDECLNTTFINSILTFNVRLIDFLINFTSNPEMYTKLALMTFIYHNSSGLYENQTAKYLIDKIYDKYELANILEQINEKNINLDIIEYLELKINQFF
jgi:hypothetical protein